MSVTEEVKSAAEKAKDKVENFNPNHKEGPVASAIEDYTARIPSDIFLWASLGSMAVSATFKILGREKDALFVGQWAPSFLMLGLYNKFVKMQGYEKDK